MENEQKRKHVFLKLIILILIIFGLVLYAGVFPVTMKLIDKKVSAFLTICKVEREFSAFSEFSSVSQKILNKAEYWFEIIKENVEEEKFESGKVSEVLLTCAANFPAEKVKITSCFGIRKDPFSNLEDFHSGIDIAAEKGSEVSAAWPGKITATGFDNIYGKYIIIEHSKEFFTKYCHLSEITVKEGNFVDVSEKIGEVGSTGRSTGNHLHFEVIIDGRNIDPKECFEL